VLHTPGTRLLLLLLLLLVVVMVLSASLKGRAMIDCAVGSELDMKFVNGRRRTCGVVIQTSLSADRRMTSGAD